MSEHPYVMVTTKHRGVFAGRLVERRGTEVTLADCRMCVHWSRSVRGIVSLAQNGPNDECRITQPSPLADLLDITGIFHCTDEARQKWEAAPWS